MTSQPLGGRSRPIPHDSSHPVYLGHPGRPGRRAQRANLPLGSRHPQRRHGARRAGPGAGSPARWSAVAPPRPAARARGTALDLRLGSVFGADRTAGARAGSYRHPLIPILRHHGRRVGPQRDSPSARSSAARRAPKTARRRSPMACRCRAAVAVCRPAVRIAIAIAASGGR